MKRYILNFGIAALCLGAMPASAAEIELKISTMFPSTHFIQQRALEPWAKSIEEKSGGRVHFTFFPAGSALGDATRQFDQAKAGVVDISVGIPAIPRGRHPRTVLIELPFVSPSAEVGTCALMGVYEKDLLADFPGTKVLSLTVTESSAVHTKAKIADLDELKGMRIRTPTPAISAMLEMLGATPVGMPPTQIYESVERGVVDGNVMPWGPVGAFKLWEVLHYHITARVNPVSMYVLMNEDRYNGLPDDIRKIIDQTSAEWLTPQWGKLWHDTDQEAIEAAKGNGNEIIDMPDAARASWNERLKPVIDSYLAKEAETLPEANAIYDDMRAAVAKCQ